MPRIVVLADKFPDFWEMEKQGKTWISVVAEVLGAKEADIEIAWIQVKYWSNAPRKMSVGIEFSVGPHGFMRTADPKKIEALRNTMLNLFEDTSVKATVWVRPIHGGYFGIN